MRTGRKSGASRRGRRERGTSLLLVSFVTIMGFAIAGLLVTASGTLVKQGRATYEHAKVRGNARGGIGVASAYLNKRLSGGTAHMPPTSGPDNKWFRDTNTPADPGAVIRDYMVIYGRAGNGLPTCTVDVAGTYSRPGSAPGTNARNRRDWLDSARAFMRATPPANVNYLARVEITGDWTTKDWYYHAWSVGLTDETAARADVGQRVVLIHQAALVPYTPLAFPGAPLTGNDAVKFTDPGTLGTSNPNDGNTLPVIGTNGNVTGPP